MNTVLYLTETLATWVCFKRDTAVNVHLETVCACANQGITCSWLQDKPTTITLIVDSDRSSIDVHPVNKVGLAPFHRSTMNALQKRLMLQYPDARVTTTCGSNGKGAVHVHHTPMGSSIKQWLGNIERCGVQVQNVFCSTELLAKMFAFSTTPYLVISHTLGSSKHVYCENGSAWFVRCFDFSDESQLQISVQETLNHLMAAGMVQSDVAVYLHGLSEGTEQVVSELNGVTEATRFESLPQVGKSTAILSTSGLSQYRSVIQLTKLALSRTGLKRLLVDDVSSYSAMYREKRRLGRQRVRMFAVILFCSISIAYTGTKIKQRQWQEKQLLEKSRALQESINMFRGQLNEISPLGVPLSQALLDSNSISHVISIGPGMLLSLLAEVLTEHSDVALDELTWVVMSGSELHQEDNAEHSVAISDSTSRKAQMLDSVESRQELPAQYSAPDSLLVRLVGRSVSSAGLRERQDAVNMLVSELQLHAEIANINVIESPLGVHTRSQSTMGDSAHVESMFELQFEVKRIDLDEA